MAEMIGSARIRRDRALRLLELDARRDGARSLHLERLRDDMFALLIHPHDAAGQRIHVVLTALPQGRLEAAIVVEKDEGVES